MASEDANIGLGVLNELLQDVAATEQASAEQALRDVSAAAAGAMELSADEILQQLDSITLLEEPILLNETVKPTTESAHLMDNSDESQSMVTLPGLESEHSDTAIDAEEDTFHEANAFAIEPSDAPVESALLYGDEQSEAARILESATTPSIADALTGQHEVEQYEEPSSGLAESSASTASLELLASDSATESATDTADVVSKASPPPDSVAETTAPRDAEQGDAQATVPEPGGSPHQPRDDSPSSDDQWESVAVLPAPQSSLVTNADERTAKQPPPAPQALFSGSLNPSEGLTGTEADENDNSDDSDESDEDEQPPPLLLKWSGADEADDDELEVDPVVADEIRSTTTTAKLHEPHTTNALLDALTQADGVAKQLTADVMQAHASKMDEIALSFDEEPLLEMRAVSVVATPESSATAFGIGYQSMRKRQDVETERDAYTVAQGPMFHELESEMTLAGDVTLSLAQSLENGTDQDEFGVDGPVSPTRVDAILQKTMTSRSHEDDQQRVLSELKKATHQEKRRLHEQETYGTQLSAPESKKAIDENALTLKELHSIYKRGLGDQEVLLMGDDAGDGKSGSVSAVEDSPNAPLSVMGRLLSKHTITEEAEEDDQDEEDDGMRAKATGDERLAAQRSSLDEEDADAVTVESDRMILVEGSGISGSQIEPTKRTVTVPMEQAQDEWQEIQLLRQVSMTFPLAELPSDPTGETGACSTTISYAEALDYFLTSDDVLVHLDHIVVEENAPPTSCFGCFTRPRLAFPDALNQRDRFFCAAATPFDPRNAVHVRMLQTIYRQLQRADRDVPLMGTHWERLGFQGSDPTTDLRGCGVLSLLQLLHLVETHSELARSFHALSQHAVRHFPMACASINVTLQCVVALRSAALYRECNKRASVFAAANVLHVALTAQLLKELQTSSDEIPVVMKRVLDLGRLYPDKALELYATTASLSAFKRAEQRHERQLPLPRDTTTTTTRAGRTSSSHAAADFTEIGLHSVDDD